MKIIAFVFLILAGVSASYSLAKEEREKTKRLESAYRFACYLQGQVENFRLPVGAILKSYSAENPNEKYFENIKTEKLPNLISELCADGGKAEGLVLSVMDSGYGEAVKGAKLLCAHLEESLDKRQTEYSNKKTAQMIFPIAAGLLAGILII